MNEVQKIIITATTANSLVYPEIKNWAQTEKKLIDDVVECYEASATVAHIHLPEGNKVETIKRIRER